MRLLVGLTVLIGTACATTSAHEYAGCAVEDARHVSAYRYLFHCGSSTSIYCNDSGDGLHLHCATEGQKRNCTRMDANTKEAVLVCRPPK